jgi:hypothetical protein
MDISIRLSSLSCFIVDLSLDLISFSFENALSALIKVSGSVKAIFQLYDVSIAFWFPLQCLEYSKLLKLAFILSEFAFLLTLASSNDVCREKISLSNASTFGSLWNHWTANNMFSHDSGLVI